MIERNIGLRPVLHPFRRRGVVAGLRVARPTRARYATEQVCPRGSRLGSEYTPRSSSRFTFTPVSSSNSRRQASSTVSPTSTKPPGSAYLPLNGACPRRISSTRPLASTTTQSVVNAGVLGTASWGLPSPQIPSAALVCFRPSWCGVNMRPPMMPPSTTMSMPLTKVERSEASHSTHWAMSSGMPARGIGWALA